MCNVVKSVSKVTLKNLTSTLIKMIKSLASNSTLWYGFSNKTKYRVQECRTFEQLLLFEIIPLTFQGHEGMVKSLAFLDDGSSPTLIEESLFEQITM